MFFGGGTLADGPVFCSFQVFCFKMMPMTSSIGVFVLVLMMAVLMLAANDPPRTVTLFFTGFVQGAFEPCG